MTNNECDLYESVFYLKILRGKNIFINFNNFNILYDIVKIIIYTILRV